MRLEIELDYEPDEEEELAVQAVLAQGEGTDKTMALRQAVQSIFGFTGAIVQGVQVIDND